MEWLKIYLLIWVIPPTVPDDEPLELIVASLNTSLGQIKEGKIHPISELWDGIDVYTN